MCRERHLERLSTRDYTERGGLGVEQDVAEACRSGKLRGMAPMCWSMNRSGRCLVFLAGDSDCIQANPF